MSHLTINLPDKLRELAEARAVEDGHASLEEYVTSLIRDDASAPRHLTPTSREQLDAMIVDGMSSPTRELTDADWAAKEQRLRMTHC